MVRNKAEVELFDLTGSFHWKVLNPAKITSNSERIDGTCSGALSAILFRANIARKDMALASHYSTSLASNHVTFLRQITSIQSATDSGTVGVYK